MNRTELIEAKNSRRRLSVRLRLTLLFGALFIAAGGGLVALNYALVDNGFSRDTNDVLQALARRLDIPEAELRERFEEVRPDQPAGSSGRPSDLPIPRLNPSEQGIFDAVQRDINATHLDEVLQWSLIGLGVMSVASIGLGWIVAGRVMRPVHNMTATARLLSETNLHERIGLGGPRDELTDLADTFDAMLERLETAFESQRRFVADASHELRTPLSIIRAEVDVALSNPDVTADELTTMAEAVREATIRSERLIDSLLALAKSDAAARGTAACDLAELVHRAADRITHEADALGLRLELDADPAPLIGDPVLLDRLVGNLVENAVRHNQAGGWLTITTRRIDGHATLHVTNSGASIDPAEVDQLSLRFYRAGPDRSGQGFGLGLPIVEAVTRAHDGRLRITSRPTGGLDVVVELPVGNGEPADPRTERPATAFAR